MKRVILIIAIVLSLFCVSRVQAADFVTSSISAQNTFTDTLTPTFKGRNGDLFINISGTWVGTVTLQFRFLIARSTYSSWQDFSTTWTSNIYTALGDGSRGTQYKIGFKTGEFGSGTAICYLLRTAGNN